MDTVTLLTTALALASPFITKSGEVFVEKATEDLYNILKSPFTKSEEQELFVESPNPSQIEKIRGKVTEAISNDAGYKQKLEEAVLKAQSSLNQQNITNNAEITKQVNIQTNSGDLNF